MGRWSQRRHAGGGPPLPMSGPLAEMIEATGGGPGKLNLTYDTDVDGPSFIAGDFVTAPLGLIATSIDVIGPVNIHLHFVGSPGDELSLTYSGSVPGVLTPQTIAIT